MTRDSPDRLKTAVARTKRFIEIVSISVQEATPHWTENGMASHPSLTQSCHGWAFGTAAILLSRRKERKKRGTPPGSPHKHAAVYIQNVSGDVSSFIGGKEADGIRYIFICTCAAQWHLREHGSALFFIEHSGHCGLNVSGSDCVCSDVARGQLACQRLCKADEAGLAGCVIGLPCLTGFAYNAGDVDDSPPSRFHHRANQRLCQQKCSRQVGVDDVVPIGTLHAQQERVLRDAGVVDENMHSAKMIENSFGCCLNGLFACNIENKGLRRPAVCGNLRGNFVQLRFVTRGQCHTGPGTGQCDGAGASNSL